MADQEGLIAAYVLDGKGGGRRLSWADIEGWSPGDGVLWLHFDYTAPAAERWLQEKSGLEEVVANALLAEESRPRVTTFDNALLIALRGVNLNPDADPEDMVSLRLFIDENRIISTRKRKLLSIADIINEIEKGKGPRSAGEFLEEIADRLMYRMGTVIEGVEDSVAELEEAVLTAESHELRPLLATIRRQTISLRRYLAPQREAIARLQSEKMSWITEKDKIRFREVYDRLVRYVEDLDAARERAAVTQEEFMSRVSENMNQRMYILSLVAAIFLPLGFLTGLLGINVGGIPGADNKMAFFVFCLMLAIVIIMQVLLFKRKRWM